MSLGDGLRKELRRLVPKMREVLTGDLSQVLEGTYGIHRSGLSEPVGKLPALADGRHRETRELLDRMLPPAPDGKRAKDGFADAYDAVLRSLAFTHLNRLVAFKLMEHPSRRLIKETVGRATKSNGFLLFTAKDPEALRLYQTGHEDEAYRHFLLARCAELDREIGVLFDPADFASRVFPGHRALLQVLGLLNSDAIGAAWEDEETLGWVYQYYTPKEMRDKARKESPAPRNPHEMAFLNQFYTPEYVVRFLVDNTLGRIWFEMRGGGTVLRDRCELLVFTPDEGIAARPKKDPRLLKLLDPAGGSGHFLLYAFTVFQWIYEEAYDDPDLGPALRRDYQSRETFAAAVPALILEHNIHGIDIDRRATQVASLALFLKAKTASPGTPIERANIVCAQPMPGDRPLFDDFKARTLTYQHGALARMLDLLWEHLALAAEVGSVLKVDETMGAVLAEERKRWVDHKRGEQGFLPGMEQPRQESLDFSDVSDDGFWHQAEAQLEALLKGYAEEASGAEGLRRRMFARDSAEGLHFIEVLRTRFDVVLMNPPFGAMTPAAKPYVEKHYPRTKNDIYAVFVERFLHRLHPRGFLGAITSRTGFFLSSYQKWREEVLLKEARPTLLADLGHGVMDDAMVEAAAYVLERAADAAIRRLA